jgi:hypothetical protein
MTTVAEAIALGEYELAALRLTLGVAAVIREAREGSAEAREAMLDLLAAPLRGDAEAAEDGGRSGRGAGRALGWDWPGR